jgi:hypothetical protein
VSIASYQLVLVCVVDDKTHDGHDHDDDDELGFDQQLASSSTIKIESLFKSKRNLQIEKSFIILLDCLSQGMLLHSFGGFFKFFFGLST